MAANDALGEIEQWRERTTSPQHQVDWRWVERYRELEQCTQVLSQVAELITRNQVRSIFR